MLAETAATIALTGRTPPPDLAELMPRIAPRRVLLIRAVDVHADEILNRAYQRAAPAGTEVWEIRRGGHVGGLAAAGDAYERHVTGFLTDALAR